MAFGALAAAQRVMGRLAYVGSLIRSSLLSTRRTLPTFWATLAWRLLFSGGDPDIRENVM